MLKKAGIERIGSIVSHQAKFFEIYAGCLIIAYGPLDTMPLFVRFEHFVPRAIVALT